MRGRDWAGDKPIFGSYLGDSNTMTNDMYILESLCKVEKWVERQDYKGYEPFDGLSSTFRPLTFGNLFFDRILLQLIRQSPINLRPLFGVKPLDSTIGRGYMAWGYCHRYKVASDEALREKINECLNWLIKNKADAYDDYSWGKHFDFASRGGLYKAFEPILIWTVLIGHAFIEAYETLKDEKYLKVSISICDWVMKLPRNETDKGFCFGYHNNDKEADVHNSNMMGAAFLARTDKYAKNRGYLEAARKAMEFSCTRQLPNGAWLYGEEPMNHWIDNFHTGYNLDALKYFIEYSGEDGYKNNMLKGLEFYKTNLFEKDGCPKYYHNRKYPVDSQCAAQAIDTLAKFSVYDEESLYLANKVAVWTIKNMQGPKGFFYYRIYPGGIKARTPMLHWAQATIYKALTVLYGFLQ